MEGPRSPSQTEYNRVLDFLNSQLRPNANWSLHQEYPTALNPHNLHNIRIITEDSKVLSHAVIKPLIIRSPQLNLKVAAIGSVVTDSQFRGQGLSTKVMQACIDEAARQECDIAVLWTNLYDFYRRLNFELTGTEFSCVIEHDFAAEELKNLKVIKGANVSAEAIHRLYNQHTVGSVRTTEETRKYLQIPQSNVYTAWDKSGQLAAYAIEGKGADLQNYIHEWGGGVSKVLALLSHIRSEKKTPVTILCPRHSQNMLKAIKSLSGAVINEGFLGMIKIINEAQLFSKIKKFARANGLPELVLERQNNEVIFGIPGDLLVISDEKDIVSLIFSQLQDLPHIKPATSERLQKLFPLQLWFWGWDSV